MVSVANMTKRVDALGTAADGVPGMFKRHERRGRFRGFAAFDGDGCEGCASVLLEVADSPAAKTRGLMGRRSLPPCCGMIFTDLDGGAFWMKGCKIPLDIVFLDDDGDVSIVYSMEADGGVRKYRYGDEKTAIELPAGFCERHGIDVGSHCNWRIWQ